MHIVLTIASVAAGVVFIYSSVFLYETEEHAIGNWLEDLWVRLDECHDSAISRHTSRMQRLAAITSNWLDNVFGETLFSLRAITISGCYSAAGAALLESIAVVGDIVVYSRPLMLVELWSNGVHAVLMTMLGLFAVREKRHIRFVLIVALLVFIAQAPRMPVTSAEGFIAIPVDFIFINYVVWILGLTGAIFSDCCFIIFTRWSLRKSSGMDTLAKIVGMCLVNIAGAVSFVGVPLTFALLIEETDILTSTYVDVDIVTAVLSVLAFMNVTVFLPAAAFAVLGILLLIHRGAWPLLNRAVYAVVRIPTPKKRTAFFTIGVAFVALPFEATWNLVRQTVESLL